MAGQDEYHMTFYARVTSYSNRGSDQDLDVVTTHLRELTRHPLSGLARELRAYQAISGQEISRFVHARPSIITLTAVAGPVDLRVGQPAAIEFSALLTMLTAKYQLCPQ